jgi:DNA polymerase III alpha subunit (gram-positive type)
MGTYLERDKFAQNIGNVFTFDLEYIGKTPNIDDCYIWDIAVVHLQTNTAVEISIYPDIHPFPRPFSEEFVQVTDALLKSRNAVIFSQAWIRVIQFIQTVRVNVSGPVILVAHNAFKSDKEILQIECKRNNIKMPYSFYFFDSLIFCRKILSKQVSYTLNDIYFALFGKSIENHHFAISDTVALKDILIKLDVRKLEGPIYPAYHTSLQAVKWLGPSCERRLFYNNIRSVEILVQHIVTNYCDRQLNHFHVPLQQFLEMFLVQHYNIKKGNAVSISNSLILGEWINGV